MTSNLTIEHILKQGERLLKEYMGERKGNLGYVTNVQLSFFGLERAEKGQQGIANFLGTGSTLHDDLAPGLQVSEKMLGKRKASEEVVDLTLEDEASEVWSCHSSNDDFSEIQPTGPIYTCSRCNAVISIKASESETLASAEERIKRMHMLHHADQDNLAKERKRSRAKPDRHKTLHKERDENKALRKRKGQPPLKTFFGVA